PPGRGQPQGLGRQPHLGRRSDASNPLVCARHLPPTRPPRTRLSQPHPPLPQHTRLDRCGVGAKQLQMIFETTIHLPLGLRSSSYHTVTSPSYHWIRNEPSGRLSLFHRRIAIKATLLAIAIPPVQPRSTYVSLA